MKKEELIKEWNKYVADDAEIRLKRKLELLYESGLKFEKVDEPPVIWVWNIAGERYQYFYDIDRWAAWPENSNEPKKYYQASTFEYFLSKVNSSWRCEELNEIKERNEKLQK